MGHSLGGVIAWDILNNQPSEPTASGEPIEDNQGIKYKKFSFWGKQVPTLYALGAPIGLFFIVNGKMSTHKKPEKFRFFNIFHPYDLVVRATWTLEHSSRIDRPTHQAYRFEPILGGKYEDMEPIDIPHLSPLLSSGSSGNIMPHKLLTKQFRNFTQLASNVPTRSYHSSVSPTIQLMYGKKKPRVEPPTPPGSKSFPRYDYQLQETFIENMTDYLTSVSTHLAYWYALLPTHTLTLTNTKNQQGKQRPGIFPPLQPSRERNHRRQ